MEVVKLLLKHGADPNAQDAFRGTALMRAVEHGHFEIVELLLKHGANPNIQDKKNMTALMMSSLWGSNRKEIMDLLSRYGAKVTNFHQCVLIFRGETITL